MRVGFRTINGAATRYLSAGSGMALLCLHPVGHSADIFLRNVDALDARFTVIAPDLPGHGFSDPIDFKQQAPQTETVAHYLQLLDALGIERFGVVGSSYGALLAALLAEAAPDRLAGAILVGSGSVFHDTEQQRHTLQATRNNVADGMREPTTANCRQRIANICYSAASVPEEILLSRATSLALEDRLPNFLATVDALSESKPHERVVDRLESISTPTLVIVGRDDIRVDVARHEEGVRRMPNATLRIYEECGHLPFLEQSERFNADTASFFRAIQSGQGASAADSAV